MPSHIKPSAKILGYEQTIKSNISLLQSFILALDRKSNADKLGKSQVSDGRILIEECYTLLELMQNEANAHPSNTQASRILYHKKNVIDTSNQFQAAVDKFYRNQLLKSSNSNISPDLQQDNSTIIQNTTELLNASSNQIGETEEMSFSVMGAVRQQRDSLLSSQQLAIDISNNSNTIQSGTIHLIRTVFLNKFLLIFINICVFCIIVVVLILKYF